MRAKQDSGGASISCFHCFRMQNSSSSFGMKFETIFTTKKFQSLIDATSSSNQFHVLCESSLSLQSFVSFLGQVTFTIHKERMMKQRTRLQRRYVNTWGFCNFHGWRSIQMKQFMPWTQ
ncbi:uncharacterized protein LOC123899486 isoform X2 [Trifolium pratense]|uniref:uncharacterized protein LOC123899486 isoform X2 n=1 Tax=Trifolium pratense TaxID=57577 RepID=UPI001E694F12|nr:uncharacterized protein LOC123899486 isoform X2 [Trifolium pratense]XP_045806585.1 uncharacterized protein LOC123899486 isoform X2 [Trifolium pratense]